MSDLSRRALVTALPVVAVPTLPALADIGKPKSNPATLAGMERDLARILADLENAYAENVAAFRRVNAAKRDWQCPRLTNYGARAQYRHDAQLARWRVRLARLREEHGCIAAEARIQELRDDRDSLCERGWHVRATDLAGLQIKARMAEHSHQVLGSLVADVLAMQAL